MSFLKISGGRSVGDCVARVLLAVIEPALAKGYNWKGQRGKLKLSALKAIVGITFGEYKICHTFTRFIVSLEEGKTPSLTGLLAWKEKVINPNYN